MMKGGAGMEISEALREYMSEDVYKLVLSRPYKTARYKRITVQRLSDGYYLEKLTETQAFHKNINRDELIQYLEGILGSQFAEVNAWDNEYEYNIRITKKGKVLKSRRKPCVMPKARETHNREKRYILPEGTVIAPMVDMGVMSKDGKVISSMYAKYRQINRFIEMIDDEIKHQKPDSEFTVIDFGCGKSYLTFLLYYYLTQIRDLKVKMIGLDLKRDVIEKCRATAEKYGYGGLSFEVGDIGGFKCDFHVDMVVSLHACDTATDHALYNAVEWGCEYIFSVPCCQHELASQMRTQRLPLATRYGVVKERMAALLTDSIRANLLKYKGYQVQLLEFIEMEHTPKNILIRARRSRIPQKVKDTALKEVEDICWEFSFEQTLYSLMLK